MSKRKKRKTCKKHKWVKGVHELLWCENWGLEKEQTETVQVTIATLDVFFNGNFAKTDKWLRIRNPLLGNIRPWDMIEVGREKKLLKFINNQISLNKPFSKDTKEAENK